MARHTIIDRVPERTSTTPALLDRLKNGLSQIKDHIVTKLQGLLGRNQHHAPRQLALETLENRSLLAGDVVGELPEAVELQEAEPVVVAQPVAVNTSNPIGGRATFTMQEDAIGARVALFADLASDGVNQLRHAIHVLIGEDNMGVYARNGDDKWRDYHDVSLPMAGTELEIVVRYDGDELTYQLLAEDQVLLDRTVNPEVDFGSVGFAGSNMRWDTNAVMGTMDSAVVWTGDEPETTTNSNEEEATDSGEETTSDASSTPPADLLQTFDSWDDQTMTLRSGEVTFENGTLVPSGFASVALQGVKRPTGDTLQTTLQFTIGDQGNVSVNLDADDALQNIFRVNVERNPSQSLQTHVRVDGVTEDSVSASNVPVGEYTLVMTSTDDAYTAVITRPDGQTEEFALVQGGVTTSGQIVLNVEGPVSVLELQQTVLGSEVVEESTETGLENVPETLTEVVQEMQTIVDNVQAAQGSIDSGDFAALTAEEQEQVRSDVRTGLERFQALQTGFSIMSANTLPTIQTETLDLSAIDSNTISNIDFQTQLLLDLEELGGQADIRSWQGKNDVMDLAPASHSDAGEVLSASGSALSIDLSTAESFTTGLSFDIHSSDGPVTVVFYRDAQLISEHVVSDCETVTVSDPLGLTGAVIALPGDNGDNSTIAVSNVQVTGTKNLDQRSSYPLDIRHNTQISLLAAPDWSGGLTEEELRAAAEPHGVGYSWDDGAWDPSWWYFQHFGQTGEFYNLMEPKEQGDIERQPHYLSSTGVRPVPPEFYEVIDDHQVIFAPGAPQELVTRLPLLQSGHQFTMSSGDSYAELVPSDTLDITMAYLEARPIGSSGAGFVGELDPPQEPDRAVGQADHHYNVTNTGRNGGEITARVYAGYGNELVHTHTFSTTFAHYETKGLVAPISPQGSGSGSGTYLITVTYPDGRTETMASGTLREYNDITQSGIGTDTNDPHFNNTVRDAAVRINDAIARGNNQGALEYFADLGDTLKTPVIADLDNSASTVVFSDLSEGEQLARWEELTPSAQDHLFSTLPTADQVRFFGDLPLARRADVWQGMNRETKDAITERSIEVAQALGTAPNPVIDARFAHFARDIYLAKNEAGQEVQVVVVGDRHVEIELESGVEQTENIHTMVAAERDALLVAASGVVGLEEATQVLSESSREDIHMITADQMDGNAQVLPVELPKSGTTKLFFTLESSKMVNMWVNGTTILDLSLKLSGGSNGMIADQSDNAGSSGESVSVMLEPGTYVLDLHDATAHGNTTSLYQSFPIDVQFEMKDVNLANIEGKISIDQRDVVMDVSMRVAKFDTDDNGDVVRNEDYHLSEEEGGVPELDRDKPVWVVVHGMNSQEDSSTMDPLTEEMVKRANEIGAQVITVNWQDAARALPPLGQDAPWTSAVGKWAAEQLANQGFNGSDINIIGHSHGTYVGWAMAQQMIDSRHGQVNTIIALDPAGNIPLISQFDHRPINFTEVSTSSIAIDSSWASGSNELAATADVSFKIDSPDTLDLAFWNEHQLAVTTFTEILKKDVRLDPIYQDHFDLAAIMNGTNGSSTGYSPDMYDSTFEGVIHVSAIERTDENGDSYYQGTPWQLSLFGNEDDEEDHFTFNA